MSARPLSRPEAFTLATVPSMTAPSYCDGLRVVIVKRSSACAFRVLRALSSVATSRVPCGTPKSPRRVGLGWSSLVGGIDIPLGLVRRLSIEAPNRHWLTEIVIIDAARHSQVAAVVNRLKGDGEVISSTAGSRHHQLITRQRGARIDGPSSGPLLCADLSVRLEGDPRSARRSHGDAVLIAVDRDRLRCLAAGS